uniref:Fimbrial assembly family protein n=1 Tax=Thermodesulfobacterium geofontis TaxID=1295609 RepID=A0A7V5XHE1_9BACT
MAKNILYYQAGNITFYKKKIFKVFDRKIGVISVKDVIFIKKNYPLKAKKHLKKIIDEEISTLFSSENFSFFYQILNETSSQIEVGIWGFDKSIKDELINKYQCSYIIPEPLCFFSEIPLLLIYKSQDMYVFIHLFKNRVLNFLTLKELNKESINLFLKSIKNISTIKSYIADETLQNYFTGFDLQTEDPPSYQLFLDYINFIQFKNFKVKHFSFKLEPFFFLRILAYSFLSLTVAFLLSSKNYDEKIKEIDKKVNAIKVGETNSREKKILQELEKIRANKQDVLYILNSLEEILPKGTAVKKLSISEETADLTLSTNDPLIVINNLNFEKCFSYVKLSSPINKEEGSYLINIKVGLNKCKLID